MSNPYANYKVGLVMSCMGLNDVQRAVLHKRLQEIARAGGADPYLTLVVPSVHADKSERRSMETTERLVEAFARTPWIRVEVVLVENAPQALAAVLGCDETWCATTRGQSERRERPGRVYYSAQLTPHRGRFKFLPFWIELEEPAPKPKNVKPLKGW